MFKVSVRVNILINTHSGSYFATISLCLWSISLDYHPDVYLHYINI